MSERGRMHASGCPMGVELGKIMTILKKKLSGDHLSFNHFVGVNRSFDNCDIYRAINKITFNTIFILHL